MTASIASEVWKGSAKSIFKQDRYVFPCYGLLQTLAGLVDAEDGYVEVFKIDYCPLSGIPTLNLILSGTVDRLLLDAVFERYQALLQAAAAADQL